MILLGAFFYFKIIDEQYLWMFLPSAVIGIIGFLDDHYNLPVALRFIVQCFAAAAGLIILGEGGVYLHEWISSSFFIPLPICFALLVVAVVWMINLFNFMDGSDGIAAQEAIFVFGIGGYILFQFHAYELATLAWGLVCLLAGFLSWNWPTARIFMGDSGSCFLGCTIAFYALISYKLYNVPWMVWVLLTALFWFDATVTLVRRILAGQEWRKPHKLHAYQRLIQGGWSHTQVLLGAIAANCVLAGLAVWIIYEPRLTYFAFGVAMTMLTCLYLLIEIYKPMFRLWHKA
jgi:Fuc2NAc and GlcNAc transferase